MSFHLAPVCGSPRSTLCSHCLTNIVRASMAQSRPIRYVHVRMGRCDGSRDAKGVTANVPPAYWLWRCWQSGTLLRTPSAVRSSAALSSVMGLPRRPTHAGRREGQGTVNQIQWSPHNLPGTYSMKWTVSNSGGNPITANCSTATACPASAADAPQPRPPAPRRICPTRFLRRRWGLACS
jgi:hypothetical protein